MKYTIKKSELKRIIAESVKRALKESNDLYYGGGLPDGSYKYDGDEIPNDYDDFEGTPAWNAIEAVLSQNNINDLDFKEIQTLRQLAKPLQKLDRCMGDVTREVIRDVDGTDRTIQQEDIINFIKETMPNYYVFINQLHLLWRDFKWMVRKIDN